jgi:hypothetical protein
VTFSGSDTGRSASIQSAAASRAARPALMANLAVEVAPVQANLMAAVKTLSARLLIGCVAGSADIALLAVHLMITAVTPREGPLAAERP